MSKFTRFFERNFITILTVISVVVTIFILVIYFPFLKFDSVTAANFFGNIVGGIISGVIVALALTLVSNIEERKRMIDESKTSLSQLRQLWFEYSKDLIEKLKLSLRPDKNLTSFSEQERQIKIKVDYLLQDFSSSKSKLKEVLSKLSFLEYNDFVHRLSNYGKVKKDFGDKVPKDLSSILSELYSLTEKVSDHYNVIYGKYVSGTTYSENKQAIVFSGKTTEKEVLQELLSQDSDLIVSSFKKIVEVKSYLEEIGQG